MCTLSLVNYHYDNFYSKESNLLNDELVFETCLNALLLYFIILLVYTTTYL